MSQEEVDKLRNCCISQVSKKNAIGQSFICRICYVIDGDSIVVSRCRDSFLETYTLRVARIDSAEVPHTESDYKPDEKEAAFGNRAKLAVLNWVLPDHFKETADQKHDYRFQKVIFDKFPVLLQVECPTTCTENGKCKPLKLDLFSRIVSEVTRYGLEVTSSTDPYAKETLSDMLLRRKLANPYTGGKKDKEFPEA